MENAEITSIKQILGLQHGKQYDSVKTLRYGHLMIMTDQGCFELLTLTGSPALNEVGGGNDASHSAEATARRGSSSFARPDVDMHSRSGMATLSTIGAVASAMGLAVEKSSKVVCSKPKFPSNFVFYVL
ncbi:DNA topoisomerase 2 [Camellia lanceoleosa]|uniref:DNA topoisomerase 2 n=1 Tax=Camellia lanceoleosa TaxID=1840588 RepID=A0ACC0ISJ5_9ERIC|nr:DNA topoisomerase 2 [Camellia lanceoleosa]